MQFKIKRPCEGCPFRCDVHPYLRAERAAELAAQLSDDNYWFACHVTTGVKRGRRIKAADQSHCAGAMRVLWRQGAPNIAMRLALTFKLITVEDLSGTKPPVFRSLKEFAAHHGGKGHAKTKNKKGAR